MSDPANYREPFWKSPEEWPGPQPVPGMWLSPITGLYHETGYSNEYVGEIRETGLTPKDRGGKFLFMRNTSLALDDVEQSRAAPEEQGRDDEQDQSAPPERRDAREHQVQHQPPQRGGQ